MVPDLAALADAADLSSVPTNTHSWKIDTVYEALGALLAEARSKAVASSELRPVPIRPTQETLSALEGLVSSCPDVAARKAHSPVLFLAAGILFDHLFNSSTSSSSNSSGASASPSASPVSGLKITVHPPTLPVAAGLGSSAAFSVSTAGALLDLQAQLSGSVGGLRASDARICNSNSEKSDNGVSSSANSNHNNDSNQSSWAPAAAPSLSLVNEWAYCCEMLFHGVPSGLDNTVAT